MIDRTRNARTLIRTRHAAREYTTYELIRAARPSDVVNLRDCKTGSGCFRFLDSALGFPSLEPLRSCNDHIIICLPRKGNEICVSCQLRAQSYQHSNDIVAYESHHQRASIELAQGSYVI